MAFKTPCHACQAPPDTGPRMNLVSSTWECCLWVAGAVVIGRPTLISGHGQLVSRNADFVFKLTIKFERPLFVCRCCNFQHHHGTMCIHHYRRYIQLLSSFTSCPAASRLDLCYSTRIISVLCFVNFQPLHVEVCFINLKGCFPHTVPFPPFLITGSSRYLLWSKTI